MSLVPRYTFISASGPETSKRRRELRLAQIRSHAAKASWHNRGVVQEQDDTATIEREIAEDHRSITVSLPRELVRDDYSAPAFWIQVPETIRICMFRLSLVSLRRCALTDWRNPKTSMFSLQTWLLYTKSSTCDQSGLENGSHTWRRRHSTTPCVLLCRPSVKAWR
jgi:hypothetical protein